MSSKSRKNGNYGIETLNATYINAYGKLAEEAEDEEQDKLLNKQIEMKIRKGGTGTHQCVQHGEQITQKRRNLLARMHSEENIE